MVGAEYDETLRGYVRRHLAKDVYDVLTAGLLDAAAVLGEVKVGLQRAYYVWGDGAQPLTPPDADDVLKHVEQILTLLIEGAGGSDDEIVKRARAAAFQSLREWVATARKQ